MVNVIKFNGMLETNSRTHDISWIPSTYLGKLWSNGRKSWTEKNVLPGSIVLLALTGFSEAYPQQLGDIYINYSVGTPANEL